MTRASLLEGSLLTASLLALSGCTILLAPDRDAIAPDLDAQAQLDAGMDAGIDAGNDGGGCRPTETLEVTCEGGGDEDCDGYVDCEDTDCRGASVCCRGARDVDSVCLASLVEWRAQPPGTTEIDIAGSCGDERVTSFGVDGVPRALMSAKCQPIGFGMRFEVQFDVEAACGLPPCDYAALALTPLPTLVSGEPLSSELRAVVRADKTVALERAGTELARSATPFTGTAPIRLRLVLEPGPDESGRDVLFATATFAQDGRTEALAARAPILPLADLRCLGPSGPEVGLYAAIEGVGEGVQVRGPLARTEFQCSNPSQFLRRPAELSTTSIEACAPGGVGAPALVNYCREHCEATPEQIQWELWADASDVQRSDESFRFIDFGVCGWAATQPQPPGTGEWFARPADADPFLWADDPSSREPTLLPIAQHGVEPRVERVAFAYAERTTAEAETYAVHGGVMLTAPTERPGTRRQLLTPAQTSDCRSLRDPLLLADWEATDVGHSVSAAWLLFTCEREDGAPRSIGAARLSVGASLALDESTPIRTDVLSASVGAYAERGVFGAEGFIEASGADRIARIWFLARDGRGRVRLAYAQGRGPASEGLPILSPYAANPLLDGSEDILGDDCDRGCTLTGLSVTPSFIELGNYQFLIARSRLTPTGPQHDLVPLLQPAPDDR